MSQAKEVVTRINMHGIVEVKTCPFCGQFASMWCSELAGVPELEPDYYMMCNDCGAHGQSCETPHRAAERWNSRV